MPFDPENFTLQQVNDTVVLNCTASPSNPVSYYWFRRTPVTGSPFNPGTEIPIGITQGTSFTDDTVVAGHQYEYQVFGYLAETNEPGVVSYTAEHTPGGMNFSAVLTNVTGTVTLRASASPLSGQTGWYNTDVPDANGNVSISLTLFTNQTERYWQLELGNNGTTPGTNILVSGIAYPSQTPTYTYQTVPMQITFPVAASGGPTYADHWDDMRDGETRRHRATDIHASYGTPVYACTAGVVDSWMPGISTAVDVISGGGYQMRINTNDGRLRYVYAHFGPAIVDRAHEAFAPGIEPGVPVQKGQHIGWVGESGSTASGPHLHLEIRDLAGEVDDDPYADYSAQLGTFDAPRYNPYPSLQVSDPAPVGGGTPPPSGGSGGSGGSLTNQIYSNFTGEGYTSQYHLYASGLDWNKKVGLLVYVDGTGEYGIENVGSSYLMAGTNGMINIAKKHNLMLLTPFSPDANESWHYNDPPGYTRWLGALIRYVYSRYNIYSDRFVGGGYSSGAQVMTRFLTPLILTRTLPPIATDGVIVPISFGGAPASSMGTAVPEVKANIRFHWDVGDQDDAGGYDGAYGALAGRSWYQNNGFMTSITVRAGVGHGRSGAFGGIMDTQIAAHVPSA